MENNNPAQSQPITPIQNSNLIPEPTVPLTPEPVVQTPSEPTYESKSGFPKWIIIIVVLLLIIVTGVSIFFLSKNSTKSTKKSSPATNKEAVNTDLGSANAPISTSSNNQTINWAAYEGSTFSIKYPNNWYSTDVGYDVISKLSCVNFSDKEPKLNVPTSTIVSVCTSNQDLVTSLNLAKNPKAKPYKINDYSGYRGINILSNQSDDVILTNPKTGSVEISQFYKNTSVFNEMLPAFKFIDPAPQINMNEIPAPAPVTETWNKYIPDDKYIFSFKFPTGWNAQVRDSSQNNQRIINFIDPSNPNPPNISFTISNSWAGMENIQSQPTNYSVGGVAAYKVDPPQKNVQQLSSYSTNIYFEISGVVYKFTCTHNWIQSNIDTCNNILSTVLFAQ